MRMTGSGMRVAIMGSGGVGGYFGARLAQAGVDATFVARGAHLQAMRQSGLRIEGPGESFTLPVKATGDPRTIGPVDVVLFAVKLWDAEAAAASLTPLMRPGTAVVSLLNGIDSEDTLAAALGADHVMGGVAEISATIGAPGFVRRISPTSLVRFGERDRRRSVRAEALAALLAQAGVAADLSDDIELAIWNKFVFLVGLSATTALTRQPVGKVRADPDTRALLRQVMTEALRVGQAAGVRLPDATVDERLQYIDAMPGEIRASMAADLLAGRRLELPWLSGAVVRKGRELAVPTPANDFVCQALKLDVMGKA
jgi:2-dehydropantoate 2-reductase